ncbi:MAG: hypothetical protein V1792_19565, partial [Pseudomonadota bacterium]
MSENETRKVRVYRLIGKAGAFLLFAGCFMPIQTDRQSSTAENFMGGLSQLSRGYTNETTLQVLLCATLLIISSHCLMTVFLGKVEKLRIAAIQAWVVLLVSYSYYFGAVIPIHYGADWGWSVLFLGATLVTFGAFRAHRELEDEREQATPERT